MHIFFSRNESKSLALFFFSLCSESFCDSTISIKLNLWKKKYDTLENSLSFKPQSNETWKSFTIGNNFSNESQFKTDQRMKCVAMSSNWNIQKYHCSIYPPTNHFIEAFCVPFGYFAGLTVEHTVVRVSIPFVKRLSVRNRQRMSSLWTQVQVFAADSLILLAPCDCHQLFRRKCYYSIQTEIYWKYLKTYEITSIHGIEALQFSTFHLAFSCAFSFLSIVLANTEYIHMISTALCHTVEILWRVNPSGFEWEENANEIRPKSKQWIWRKVIS